MVDRSVKVVDNILGSAVKCLETHNPNDISLKQIAEMAGTNPSMINYYFGSKDGLMIEIVNVHLQDLMGAFKELRRERLADPAPIKHLVRFLITEYRKRPELVRILSYELFREESKVRDFFFKNWPALTRELMEDYILETLGELHQIDEVRIQIIIEMIRSVVFWPLLLQPLSSRVGTSPDIFASEKWIETVSDVFEHYLSSKCALEQR